MRHLCSPSLRAVALGLAALGALALGGCGKGGAGPSATTAGAATPAAEPEEATPQTRNTTRLGGPDPVSDAAAVARATYPGVTSATRPQAVVLVGERHWAGALSASALASAPLGAPLLYAEEGSLPQESANALAALHPLGAKSLGGAQVIEIGTSAPLPEGLRARSVAAAEPAATAVAVASLLDLARGGATHQVIVVDAGAPAALQMPAAGLAAESGAPILFVTAAGVPAATARELARLGRPSIYLVGSPSLPPRTMAALARYGRVTPILAGRTPAEQNSPAQNAVAVARFTDGAFGWGVKEPGHGLVFANAERPLDGPAGALLSATGDYGPLLLLEAPEGVPRALAQYLRDIQPAYGTTPQYAPVHGAYNHGWLIGDTRAISLLTQAELDSMLEISPRPVSSEEEASPSFTE